MGAGFSTATQAPSLNTPVQSLLPQLPPAPLLLPTAVLLLLLLPAVLYCCCRLKKRKEFEDTVRRVGRWNHGIWAKVRRQAVHAKWADVEGAFCVLAAPQKAWHSMDMLSSFLALSNPKQHATLVPVREVQSRWRFL